MQFAGAVLQAAHPLPLRETTMFKRKKPTHSPSAALLSTVSGTTTISPKIQEAIDTLVLARQHGKTQAEVAPHSVSIVRTIVADGPTQIGEAMAELTMLHLAAQKRDATTYAALREEVSSTDFATAFTLFTRLQDLFEEAAAYQTAESERAFYSEIEAINDRGRYAALWIGSTLIISFLKKSG